MRVRLVAAGTRMPAWTRDGFAEYARRLPKEFALDLDEIPVERRTGSVTPAQAVTREGERMLKALPADALVVALDERGEPWTTRALAERLAAWRGDGRDVALLVGGPDGLAAPCLERAQSRWSLSALTLPHALVRVVVAEQIYRAWSILQGHPYHRD